jgi:hypothetical protein
MPNNKKNKKTKKKIEYKSKLERVAEVVEVFTKLRENGLTQQNTDIQLFKEICNTYIENGDSNNGKIKIHGTKRIIEYILPKRKDARISIILRFDKHI